METEMREKMAEEERISKTVSQEAEVIKPVKQQMSVTERIAMVNEKRRVAE